MHSSVYIYTYLLFSREVFDYFKFTFLKFSSIKVSKH